MKTEATSNLWIRFLLTLIFCTPVLSQERITASFLFHQADSIASTFRSNPIIDRITAKDVDTSGKALFWEYTFRGNPELLQGIFVRLGSDSAFCDTIQWPPTGYALMDSGWVDSDSALAIAEKNGGKEFRMIYEDVSIIVELCKPSASPYTTWGIEYTSGLEGQKFWIEINASSGDVLYSWNTSVDMNTPADGYNLIQNYPNPFNASTRIHFVINKSGATTLKIFDINGRLIDVIWKSFCDVGDYDVQWSPTGLPSGVYLCKIESSDLVLSKKLLYSK